ncbi:MAG: hypothetical protein Q8J69_01995 [Sphingobacteriaceae bacterium]|nr:hypothetical protein [Sphingobacteriaceae bacterium]
MNKKSSWILLLLAVGITVASCKKEDPIIPTPTPPAPTKKELLTKIWKIDQILIDSIDATFFFTGARFNFRADNTVIFTMPGESPDTSNWAFNAAQTQIILSQAGEQDTLNILALTTTQFKVRSYDYDEDLESIITMSPAP